MMQLLNNCTVLLEREKPHAARTNTLTLRAKRLSHGIKKTVRPQLMNKEDFFANVINKPSNVCNKTTFQFRTSSIGGIDL